MGMRQGKNYIVSISVTPKMHEIINTRAKGTRSAFIRRAIYNAWDYDMANKERHQQLKSWQDQRRALFRAIRYLVGRINAITSTGVDLPDCSTWEMMILNYDYNTPEWRDAFAAIDELIPHIGGLYSAQRAFDDSENTRRDENEED